MKRWLIVPSLVLAATLVGCAAPTVRSNVTVFQEWPTNLVDKSFGFERTLDQENNLEYRTYENLVRNELVRLGFSEKANTTPAKLKVSLRYSMDMRDMKVVQPVLVDRYGVGAGFYGPRWSGRGYHHPFYNPLWYGMPDVYYQETSFQLYRRELKIRIAQVTDNRILYDMTVESEGSIAPLATIMPYLIRSAFTEFPAPNGAPRRIELTMQPEK